MRTQLEKNMEKLMEDIEFLSDQEMTDKIAQYLSVYRGAYKALCMVGDKDIVQEASVARTAPQSDPEPIVVGNSEFEQVIASIPDDRAHMQAITSIMADHMEGLKITNSRRYENVMTRLREVART